MSTSKQNIYFYLKYVFENIYLNFKIFEGKTRNTIACVYRCFEIIKCPSFVHPNFSPLILFKMWNSRVYVDHARVTFPRIPQWLLCASLGYFHFSSLGHVIRYCHSPQNVHTRSLARMLHARCTHVGDKICACVGGSVGLPYIRLGVSDGCSKTVAFVPR